MGMRLSYGTWGMPTVPIDVAVEHCARVGYDRDVEVEISFMVQRRPGYDPLAASEQSYAVLARAFEEAGIDRRR